MITNLKNIKPFIEKSMPFILTAILIVTTGAFGYHIWHVHEKTAIEQTYRTSVPAPHQLLRDRRSSAGCSQRCR